MTIREEINAGILLSKIESDANTLLKSAYKDSLKEQIPSDPAAGLNFKYSEVPEMLRKYDYKAKIEELLKNGFDSIEKAYAISKLIGEDIDMEAVKSNKSYFYSIIAKLKEKIEAELKRAETDELDSYDFLARAFSTLNQ